MANEDFNIDKAEELYSSYKRSFDIHKARFIKYLIECQKYFDNKNILNSPILLDRCYSTEIIETVLGDLHYILTDCVNDGKSCIITFTSTEG